MSRKLTVEDVRDELQVGRDLAYGIVREIGDKENRRWFVREDVLEEYLDSKSPRKIALKWADEVIAAMPKIRFFQDRGDVYFISDGKGVKVGFSTAIRNRMISLQIGNSSKVELLCSFAGSHAQEKHLHTALACDRIRGEWFRRSYKVEALITKLGSQ